MSDTFWKRVIHAAGHPARPWLTVSADSRLGRLLSALRSKDGGEKP